MGKLSKKDEELLQRQITCVEYGTISLEFKEGACVAISHSDRVLTETGTERRDRRLKQNNKTSES